MSVKIGSSVIMDNNTKWTVVDKFTMAKSVKKGTKAVILKSKKTYFVCNESNLKKVSK